MDDRTEDAAREQQRRRSVESLQQTVEEVVGRLNAEGTLRPGTIVFRSADGERTDLSVNVEPGGARIESQAPAAGPVVLEVRGEPARIESMLRGEKDARKQFFAGAVRVRGDMHYLSELGMRLGFLDKPIV